MSNYIDNIVKNAVTYDLVSKPLADDMANEFSIQSTYAVGDYVMHDYKLYKCISAVTTAGNWNSAKWQECKIGDEINGGVKFTAQTLTSEQKAQARNNIGAISQEEATPDAIRYSAQSLTDAQKNQARVNVGTVASTSIAEEFSTSKAYAVGDMVMYDSKLYKFKTAHSAGAWNNTQVDAISVDDELLNLRGDLNNNIGDALLELLRHVAYIDGDPQTLFSNLYEAFRNTAPAKVYYHRWSTNPVDDTYGKIEWRASFVLAEDLEDELVPEIKDAPTRSALYTLSNYSDVKVVNNETASEIEAYMIELPLGSTGFTATFGDSGGTCLYVYKRDIDGRYKCIHDINGTSIIKWYTDSETITGLSPTDRYVVGGSSKVMQAFSVTMEVI